MTDEALELGAIRARIHQLDEQLVQLLAERSAAISEVVAFKRTHGVAVVDRARETEMLDRIGEQAVGLGLPPEIARAVLRCVIDSFTVLEYDALGTEPTGA